MGEKERLASFLCGESVYEIEGVKDTEYPVELNAFVIVMDDGSKYIVEVNEYSDEKY
ncbi:MAG: hypothetical protein LBT30_05280 [Clostridiales bacterium]|jgi:hypothetical protein|nr:hypothetical protein [Clostridiales bacterium]